LVVGAALVEAAVVLVGVEGTGTLAVLLEAAGVDREVDDFFPPHPGRAARLNAAIPAMAPLLKAAPI
jgi:hypothetical protein